MSDEFNWSPSNEEIACGSQLAVAVYLNDYGQIVIRQQAGPYDSEDSVVVINVSSIDDLVAAIKRSVAS